MKDTKVVTEYWDPWRSREFRLPLIVSAKIEVFGNPEVFAAGLIRALSPSALSPVYRNHLAGHPHGGGVPS